MPANNYLNFSATIGGTLPSINLPFGAFHEHLCLLKISGFKYEHFLILIAINSINQKWTAVE